MTQTTYQDFLDGIAKQVDSLLINDTSAIGKFRLHLQKYADKSNKYLNWQSEKRKQCLEKGLVFSITSDGIYCGTMKVEVPPKYEGPGSMFVINGKTKQYPAPQNEEEEYQRYYIVLASIYDHCFTATEKIDNNILSENDAAFIWGSLHKFYDSAPKRTFIERAFECVKAQHQSGGKAGDAEKPAETKQNTKATVVAVIISLIIICIFLLSVWLIPFTPFTWLKDHPNSYGLQGSVICLITCLVVGFFKPQWRKWWWGGAIIAFLGVLLSLLGGPAGSNIN